MIKKFKEFVSEGSVDGRKSGFVVTHLKKRGGMGLDVECGGKPHSRSLGTDLNGYHQAMKQGDVMMCKKCHAGYVKRMEANNKARALNGKEPIKTLDHPNKD